MVTETLSLDRIALELTSALVKGYGKELTGPVDAAIKNVVSDYFKIYDELREQLQKRGQ